MLALLTAIMLAAAPAASAPVQCASVEITAARKDLPGAFNARLVQQASANFAKAYKKACAEGLMKKKPLVAVRGANAKRLFLYNAPEANIASIYANGGRMLLEYPFVPPDGKAHVPDADELHEAIYCAVHGASAKEQEESGRCLPD